MAPPAPRTAPSSGRLTCCPLPPALPCCCCCLCCHHQVDEVATLAAATHAQLGEAVRARYRAECGAVSALDAVARRAAYDGSQLPADLRLEDEVLVVDEASSVVEPPAQLPAPPPAEATPPGGLLSTRQLGDLTAAFLAASPGGFMRLQEAADMLCRWVGGWVGAWACGAGGRAGGRAGGWVAHPALLLLWFLQWP